MNLLTVFAGMIAFVFGIAMPFDTFFIDFTQWAGYEITLAQITLLGIGTVSVLKGVMN